LDYIKYALNIWYLILTYQMNLSAIVKLKKIQLLHIYCMHYVQRSVDLQYLMQIVTDGLMTQENPGHYEHATITENQQWKHYP